MAELQTQFNRFHEIIKIDFEDNQPLKTKRDMILAELRAGLKKKYPTNTPTFNDFVQGSYDLSTGVMPLKGEDYDIDVGLEFNLTTDVMKPVELKEIIFNILNAVAKRKVEIKRPCVRVQYHSDGDIAYHVDLAIYVHGKDFFGKMNNTLYLAKGLPGSSVDKKIWEISEPHQLKSLIKSKFSDEKDREQFRRVIKYLKRWKDKNFASSGTERPIGIALTALCYKHFEVRKVNEYNYMTRTSAIKYNDLQALYLVVNNTLSQFFWSWNISRIKVELPVKPSNDLFEKMSDNQMQNFKKKLELLRDVLGKAVYEAQITNACKLLQDVFGTDFPES